jgi:hypothetical protein
MEVRVVQDNETLLYAHPDVLVVDILDSPELRGSWWGKWSGAVRPMLPWTTELINGAEAPESSRIRDGV